MIHIHEKEDECAHIKKRMGVHILKGGWMCTYQKEDGCAYIKRRMGVHISNGGWVCTYQKEDGCAHTKRKMGVLMVHQDMFSLQTNFILLILCA